MIRTLLGAAEDGTGARAGRPCFATEAPGCAEASASGAPEPACREEGTEAGATIRSGRVVARAMRSTTLRAPDTITRGGSHTLRNSLVIAEIALSFVLATGATRHAALDPSGRPRRIPDEVKRCLISSSRG